MMIANAHKTVMVTVIAAMVRAIAMAMVMVAGHGHNEIRL